MHETNINSLKHNNLDKLNQIKYMADQLIGQGNLNIVDISFSTDYIAHAGEKTYHGHKFIKQFTNQVRTSIPDIKIKKLRFYPSMTMY